MSEFELIAALKQRLGDIGRERLTLGIGDDAALWRPDAGDECAVCCDTLISGRHFPDDAAPGDIAWKALAVNLSDLAAMGAVPRAAVLALSLPDRPSDAWLDAFCAGWSDLSAGYGLALAGGDTTRGPVLSLTVTCLGELPAGTALLRAGAVCGDGVYVSGTLGDAAHALACWPERVDPFTSRFLRPRPRIELGQALRGIASSAIDVSDGLAADLVHVLTASGVGAEIELPALPLTEALVAARGIADARELALTGGDDYELCFTAPIEQESRLCAVAAATGVRITRIGRIGEQPGLRLLGDDRQPVQMEAGGWDHFRP